MEDASSVTFVLEDEDHTLANSICYFLNKVYARIYSGAVAAQHDFILRHAHHQPAPHRTPT